RMYARYAESKGWEVEVLSESSGEHGGYKEIISRIIGRGAFSLLKFESGTHRVQRVPATEAQGRIHTSACTVAILPELDEIEAVDLNPADLRIDTYRSSGAGGQHVNKTDSANRINLTLYKLDDVMNGELEELIRALNQEHQAEELASQVE